MRGTNKFLKRVKEEIMFLHVGIQACSMSWILKGGSIWTCRDWWEKRDFQAKRGAWAKGLKQGNPRGEERRREGPSKNRRCRHSEPGKGLGVLFTRKRRTPDVDHLYVTPCNAMQFNLSIIRQLRPWFVLLCALTCYCSDGWEHFVLLTF